ncbi:TonB-denpendent receptor [Caulobacter mirabilis]|uniref:TonB-denpendent receptor n=2 Tax=Caulobacter mirabilis TaxID=69666 RepID=A0A2D2B3U1_9CAUL|nr:TonB-denpendent receptor [Caulobacter mirabilis]
MTALLAGTGLTYRRSGETFLIVKKEDDAPQSASANEGAEPSLVDELIVTAQKKEESIQDVPIAVSAFSAQALDERKIEGGPELLRAIPNVSFSKANFSMYNFSIRGIGTKAISASSDPAVAVSFNNTPLIRNRLFEQEFLDVERVEVLRGPQGTLYGRNATAGVVNMIPRLPGPNLEAMMKAELGNYSTGRLSGMFNMPLGDTLAIRVAGALTQRDGFDYNTFTKKNVNNRDLWSTRLSAKWDPVDWFSANVIWEHFEEDDQRSRTGKQLCTRDDGPAKVGGVNTSALTRARLSQGCLPGTLFNDTAYGVPNGLSFPQFLVADGITFGYPTPGPRNQNTLVRAFKNRLTDPYLGLVQSRDLREIATSYDPIFRSKNDVVQLNLSFDLSDNLQLISQTAYTEDRYYSSQDYNRFVSNPIFSDTGQPMVNASNLPYGYSATIRPPTPGGVYTDPQLGASDRMLAVDLSQSQNRQWSQEVRLQSAFEGPLNFSLGANYLKFKSQDDYYVFNNTFTYLAEYLYNSGAPPKTPVICEPTTPKECVYVDPNPLSSINGEGHNYFRSKNVVQIESWAIFGEAYWEVTPDVKITAGLRYTDDSKVSTPYPSQLLLGADRGTSGPSTGGKYSRGYPALPDIKQGWNEFTGRFVVDWKPDLSFSDDTLVYASYARGYKGGGSNPPRVDIDPNVVQYQPLAETFRPEYLNAFEIGTKNTFMNGALRLNATAFYYDYKDYQVSQIVDRISLNENFDAKNMGAELEVIWHPTPELRLDANIGYLHTELGKGAQSIDVMNRTQGNPDWTLVRPWVQVPSNCVAPTRHVATILGRGLDDTLAAQALTALCSGSARIGSFDPALPSLFRFWQMFGFTYNPLKDAPNGGRGFYANLEGNELPNAPNWTFNLGAQYTFNINDWRLTVRGDYYRQSESYARVYNTQYDRLEAWDNTNLSATLENPNSNMVVQVYVKNVFDDAPITDFFTNSDDTGLTANVFTLDPRIIGVSIMGRF